LHRPDFVPSEKEKIEIQIKTRMNKKIDECSSMSDSELADHIRYLEQIVRDFQTDIRACNWVRRDRESHMTEEQRAATRLATKGYKGKANGKAEKKPRQKKGNFIQNQLGMTMEQFAAMSDEEQQARIEKFKQARAQKPN
jgi:hypothetical protein